MFSVRAREAMIRRGGIAAPGVFLAESWRDARRGLRAHAVVARSAALRAFVFSLFAAVTGSAWLVLRGRAAEAPALTAATLAGGVLTAGLVALTAGLFVRASRPPRGGEALARVGVANTLTLLRLVLIAPVVVFLVREHYGEALFVYGLIAVTDVADGVVARRRDETSEFGVIVDPLTDILSTLAVFTVFRVDNLIPPWLYLVLIARYAMLAVGSLALFMATGPFEFRATRPGKIVGVAQALGAGFLMATAGRRGQGGHDVLFAFLGLGFASIVVSQAVIGWRIISCRPSRKG